VDIKPYAIQVFPTVGRSSPHLGRGLSLHQSLLAASLKGLTFEVQKSAFDFFDFLGGEMVYVLGFIGELITMPRSGKIDGLRKGSSSVTRLHCVGNSKGRVSSFVFLRIEE
jgi:hypothetical protein